jgi:hypothetical protein
MPNFVHFSSELIDLQYFTQFGHMAKLGESTF